MCYQVYRMGSVRSSSRRAFLGALLLCGCLSPSLPLPPPFEPSVSPSKLGADYVHLKGIGVEEYSLVTIQNNDAPLGMRGVIVEANALGEWEADVFARSGHTLHIWQLVRGQQSTPTVITIK